jgi:hypothetical protein
MLKTSIEKQVNVKLKNKFQLQPYQPHPKLSKGEGARLQEFLKGCLKSIESYILLF